MTNKIVHNGKQYEIGKWYQLKGDHYKLVEYKFNSNAPFMIDSDGVVSSCTHIDEINQDDLGTITDAPIELEEGCWYMTYANKPMYWTGKGWKETADSDLYGIFSQAEYTPLYKMERAK